MYFDLENTSTKVGQIEGHVRSGILFSLKVRISPSSKGANEEGEWSVAERTSLMEYLYTKRSSRGWIQK